MPEDFGLAYLLAELLWQQKVGVHVRAKERKRALKEARDSAAYERSRAALIRRQAQE